jgi:hypothetical protein
MKFWNGTIGTKRKLNKSEREYLLQQASHFIEKLQSRSLVSFEAEAAYSVASFYMNFYSEKGRFLALRLSNHKPFSKINPPKPSEQKNTVDKQITQSSSASTMLFDTNEIVEFSGKSEDSNLVQHQTLPAATIPAPPETSQRVKAHVLSNSPKKRNGTRILWSWVYDSFSDWEDFEKTASKVVRAWMASDCMGGRMVTWDKNRF